MTVSQCRKRSSLILKKRYGESFFVVMIFILVFVIFKIFDIALTAVLMYNNDMEADRLFRGTLSELLIKLLMGLIFFMAVTPTITGGLWWFCRAVSGEDNRSILELYTSFRLNVRAFCLYLVMWLSRLAALLPSAVSFYLSYYVYGLAQISSEQTVLLFSALQLFMLGIALIGLYLRCVTSLFLSPFIFLQNPDRGVFRILRRSALLMKGSKLEALGLIMIYLPMMLPVVTIPFVMPRAVMAFSVFSADRMGGRIWKE